MFASRAFAVSSYLLGLLISAAIGVVLATAIVRAAAATPEPVSVVRDAFDNASVP